MHANGSRVWHARTAWIRVSTNGSPVVLCMLLQAAASQEQLTSSQPIDGIFYMPKHALIMTGIMACEPLPCLCEDAHSSLHVCVKRVVGGVLQKFTVMNSHSSSLTKALAQPPAQQPQLTLTWHSFGCLLKHPWPCMLALLPTCAPAAKCSHGQSAIFNSSWHAFGFLKIINVTNASES